ncbi:MAG: AsnC family protein, partial [Candidatus Micrarchaeaceae archaeon]
MPKSPMLSKDEVEKLKLRMLRALSINARLTFSELGKKVGVGKYVAYKYFHEMVEEYGIKFVPEINVENIWKYELVKLMAHESTKTGIRENIIDKFPDVIGFEEYVIFIKFLGKKSSDEEILKAIGDSYIPQFVAKLIGEYDLM